MSKAPQPPAAPNPYQVSGAQTKSNINTAIGSTYLNNANIQSPYGSVNYSYAPSGQKIGGVSIPTVTQTTKLDPTQQAILDQSRGLTLQTGALGSQLEKNIPGAPLSFGNAPAMPTNQTVAPSQNPSVQTTRPWDMPDVQTVNPEATPDVQTVNPWNMPTPGQMPTLQAQPDVGQVASQARDAVYQQQTAYLDPQYQLKERQLHDQLQGQGIPPGSEAYNQAMDQFNRDKSFAYNQASTQAIQQGYDVANQQFNQGLAANQQGYAQGMGEQQAGFQQGMDIAQTGFGQDLSAANQNFTQGMDKSQQDFAQRLAASGQNFTQGMNVAQTGFGQDLSANQQNFNQGMGLSAQDFGQRLASNQNTFAQGLQARQQGVGEATTLYNQPVSTLASLLSAYGGGNVQAPQGTPYPSAIAPTNVTGAFDLARQGNQAAYEGQVNQYGQTVGGISGLAGNIALGALMGK